MPEFMMDGYKDLESVAEGELASLVGPKTAKWVTARVVEALLARVEGMPRDRQERELWAACQGIVDCAEKDGLL